MVACCCYSAENLDESATLAYHTARSQVNQRISVTVSKCQTTSRTSFKISSRNSSPSNSPIAGSPRSRSVSATARRTGSPRGSPRGSPPNSFSRTRSRCVSMSVGDSGRRSVSPTLVASKSRLHLICETKGFDVVDPGNLVRSCTDQTFLDSFRSKSGDVS